MGRARSASSRTTTPTSWSGAGSKTSATSRSAANAQGSVRDSAEGAPLRTQKILLFGCETRYYNLEPLPIFDSWSNFLPRWHQKKLRQPNLQSKCNFEMARAQQSFIDTKQTVTGSPSEAKTRLTGAPKLAVRKRRRRNEWRPSTKSATEKGSMKLIEIGFDYMLHPVLR